MEIAKANFTRLAMYILFIAAVTRCENCTNMFFFCIFLDYLRLDHMAARKYFRKSELSHAW